MPAASPRDPEHAERLRCAASLLGFSEDEDQTAIRSMTGHDRAALTEVIDWIREYEIAEILYDGARDTPF